MPELNSLRGIAVLMVMLYHGFYWGLDLTRFAPAKRLFLTTAWSGRLGVNLFFVLSGFLITGLLIDSRARSDYYKRFFIRRSLRILPALFLVLIALLITHAAPLKFVLLSFVYLSNLTPLFGVAIAYPVLWSLAVEEHFYLAWPAVVRNFSNRFMLALCIAIVALSPLSRLISFYLASRSGWVSYRIFDYTWNSADGLACGAFLAIFLREFQPSRKNFAKLLLFLLAGAVGFWIVGFPFGIITRRLPLGAALQIVPWNLAFTAMLGFLLLLGSGPWKRWSRLPALEFLGDISYGLYLYHLLVLRGIQWLDNRGAFQSVHIDPFWDLGLQFLMLLSASILVAYVSRRYFEEPILRLKARWT